MSEYDGGSPYAPHSDAEREAMLDSLDVDSESKLFDIPSSVAFDGSFGIDAKCERTVRRDIESLLDENDDLVESVALDLFTEFTDTRVRKLGVSVSNLSFADEAQAKLTGFTDDGNTSRAGSRTDAMSRGQRSLTDF